MTGSLGAVELIDRVFLTREGDVIKKGMVSMS